MRLSLIYILLLLGGSNLASSQEQNSESTLILNVLSSLDTITSIDKESGINFNNATQDLDSDFVSVYFDSPSDKESEAKVIKIIKTFYSKSDNPVAPEDVLGFLTNAYSEHDFYDSGNWVKESPSFNRYIPFKGELPPYSLNEFILPISGSLTSSYGYRPKRHRYHHGIDVAVNIGDSVKCALPGVVTKTGYERAGYGHYIVVAHSGDLETIYAHLQRPIAIPGQKVKAGEIIGLAGSSGNSTGPHLHFETRYHGMPVDPFSWFNLSILIP